MKKNKILKIVRYNLEKNLRNKWFIGLNILLFVVSIVALNFGTVKNILKQSDILPAGEKIKFEIVAYCKTEASATNRELKEIHKNNTLNSSGRSILELKLIEDNFFNYFLSFFKFILDIIKKMIIILDTNQKKVANY